MTISRYSCIICSKKGCRLFYFPKDPARMKSWLARLKLTHLSDKHPLQYIHHSVRICADHFEEKYFTSTLRTRMHRLCAVPIDLRTEQEILDAKNDENSSTVSNEKLHTNVPSNLQVTSNDKEQGESDASNGCPDDSASTFSSENQSSDDDFDLSDISDNSDGFSDSNVSTASMELVYESADEVPVPSSHFQKMAENKNLKSRLPKEKNEPSSPQKSKSQRGSVLVKLRSMLSKRHYDFVKSKINLCSMKAKGRRWSAKDKSFALNILYHSPAAYRMLRKHLSFPGVSTLQRCAGNIAKEDGFCPLLLSALCEKVKEMSESEKLCTIVFGEMAVKSQFSYNVTLDMVDGYASGIKENTSGQPATHAVVFMLRGIASNWKQVIAYYFRGSVMPDGWYKATFTDVLAKVLSTGMNVIASVCNQGPNYQALYSSLGVTADKPFFFIGNRKVYALYDIPHLANSILNNLKKNDLKFTRVKDGNEYLAVWKDVEEMYENDLNLKYRIAPKLLHKHIYGRLVGTNYSAKVFTYSVAAGLYTHHMIGNMQPTALATADFVGKMSKILDSMNSRSQFGETKISSAVSNESCHLTKWKRWVKWISSWKFVNKEGKNIRLPCQSRLMQTLSATVGIWETLSDHISFLLTSRLNQDCLADTFSAVKKRGEFLDSPSTLDFRRAVQSVMFFTFAKKCSPGSCKCSKLECSNLIDFKMKKITSEIIVSDEIDKIGEMDSVVENGNIPSATDFETNLIAYICAVITKLMMEKNFCQDCKNFLAGPKRLNIERFSKCFKDYEDSPYELKWPTDEFYKYILELGHLFFQNFGHHFRKRGLRKTLYEMLEKVSFDFFQHDHKIRLKDEIINSFIIMMIKYHIKNINGENFGPNESKKAKLT